MQFANIPHVFANSNNYKLYLKGLYISQIPTEESDYRSVSNAFLQDNNKKSESRNDTPDSTKVCSDLNFIGFDGYIRMFPSLSLEDTVRLAFLFDLNILKY